MDPAFSCVWDVISTAFQCDPQIVHAIYCASLGPVARARFIIGAVPFDEMANVFTFFGLTVDLQRVPANNVRDMPLPPIQHYAGRPGFPTIPVCLQNVGQNNFHLWVGMFDRQLPNGVPPVGPGPDIIGVQSRVVPQHEIRDILTLPSASVGQTAAMFAGMAPQNAAAGLSSRYGFPLLPPSFVAPFQRLIANPVVAEVIPNWMPTAAERRLAQDLARDFKSTPTELKAAEYNALSIARTLDSAAEFLPFQPVELVLLNGMTGSGKSFALRAILRNITNQPGYAPNSIRILTANQILRQQIMNDIPLPNSSSYNYPTFTRPLFEACTETLVIDDAGMFYPGFVPLVLLANPGIRRVILTFDAAQGEQPFPQPDSLSRQNLSTVRWLSGLSNNYATTSQRLSVEVNETFGLPAQPVLAGRAPTHGNIYIVSKAPPGIPYFAASPRFVEVKNRGGRHAIAFADAQGLNPPGDIAIDCGGLTDSIDDKILWPVLTRARNNIFLVLSPRMPGQGGPSPTTYGASRILSAILAVSAASQSAIVNTAADPQRIIARAVVDHLVMSLSPQASQQLQLPARSAMVGAYTLDQYPTLETKAFSVPGSARPYDAPAFSSLPIKPKNVNEPFPRRAAFRDALQAFMPITNETVVSASPHQPEHIPDLAELPQPDPSLAVRPDLAANTLRELWDKRSGQLTNQIDDNASPRVLHHRRRDVATVNLSLARRIHPSKPDERLTTDFRTRAKQLRKGFLSVIPLPQLQFNEALFEQCTIESIQSWAGGRTIVDLERAVANSPADWDPRFTRLFLKGQIVKKLHKLNGPASPGQIIATFPLVKTLRDATWALYVERSVAKHTPDNVYLHARANVTQMQGWYHKHFDREAGTTTLDYTAWDTGCDEAFQLFDEWLLRQVGIPASYISLYRDEKMNTRSFMGPMPVMQFSGDRWTWLFNTYRDAALTGHAFDLPKHVPICISGDDVLINKIMRLSKHFSPRAWPMIPKMAVGMVGDFCGFQYGGENLGISPETLLSRAIVGLESGRSAVDFWDSIDYASRFTVQGATSLAHIATARHISELARVRWHLPPSRF